MTTTHADGTPAADPEEQPAPYVVLVPVGSAAAVRRTAPIATLLAKARDGTVIFLAVRRLRYDIAPRADRVPEWLTEAIDETEDGVAVEAIARLGQSVVGAIEATARELDAGALLLHWESGELTIPRAEREAFTQLFSQPPCTALLLRGRFRPDESPSIMVAGNGERATDLAVETASTLLQGAGGGTLRALRVIRPGATEEDLAAAVEAARLELPGRPGVRAEGIARRARSHEAAVLEAISEEPADLAVIAAPQEGVIRRLGRTGLPRRLLRPSATPVLIVSRPEARPVTTFHRLWAHIYKRLPQLTEEEKIATYMQLRRAARANVDYHVLMMLSAAVATLGLLLNSAAVVIGAMLLAPLMSPIAGSALGVVQGDSKLLRLSVGSVLSGTATAIVTAALVAFWLPGTDATSEFLARTEPGMLDLLVALGSGMAAAYTLSRPGLSAALPGVAVAAALVPPLASTAVGAVLGEWTDAAGAALLFGTNLVAIAAASAVTFLWLGFRPDADRVDRFGVFGRGVVGLFVLLVAVAIPLTVLSANALSEDARAGRVERTLRDAAGEIQGVEVTAVEVGDGDGELRVHARLLAEEPLSPEQADALRQAIEGVVDDTVRLELEVTQLIRNGP